MDFDALKARLAPLVFRLKWGGLRNQEYGTGFFISAEGLALTAYHNLAKALENGGESITAEWQGKPVELFRRCPSPEDEGWQRRLDVAVLEARPPLDIEAPVCGLAYLDASWSRQERTQYWKGRPAVLMGYHGENDEDARLIPGSISADEPIVDPVVEDKDGNPAGRAVEALNLGIDFQLNCRESIRGVSGAPLVDQDTGEIVGVQFAALPDRERAIARELHQVAKEWVRLGDMARAIPKPVPAPVPVAASTPPTP